jgi:hypothetical protein
MSTPEENAEIAVDESQEASAREKAIDGLEAANECGSLADVVLNERVDDRYRERALTALAHPQCTATLRSLAESSDLSRSMRQRAQELLAETPDSAGKDTGAGTE